MKVNIRNDVLTAKVRVTDIPIVRTRFSPILALPVDAHNFGGPGYLMGMLGLTYTRTQTVATIPATFKSDDIPLVRIRNTD